MNNRSVCGVIPARYGSSRLPGKALVDIAGKPMIQHVWEWAKQVRNFDYLIVATDSDEIYDAVIKFGGRAIMTLGSHRNGTERVNEVAQKMVFDYYVNIQGDIPVFDPLEVEKLVYKMKAADGVWCLYQKGRDVFNNSVKAIMVDGMAVYFSRYFPYGELAVGIYGYSRPALLEYIELESTELEEKEGLEQMRWVENCISVKMFEVKCQYLEVNTPQDLAKVRMNMGDTEDLFFDPSLGSHDGYTSKQPWETWAVYEPDNDCGLRFVKYK